MSFIKKRWKYIVVALIALFIGGLSGPTQAEVDDAKSKASGFEKDIADLRKENEELVKHNKDLQKEIDDLAPYIELAEADAKAKAEELKKKEAEEKAKKEAEEKKKAEEAKKKEEQAKKEAEEKEKKGYDTGITYDQLARTPDDYLLEKVKFKGKVVQVMEGGESTQLRIAINDNIDTVIYAEYNPSIVDSRVLENDVITIMGTSAGLITYESTLGGQISIPGVIIDKIEN
ncbi:toxin regulator [Cytobacillus kochii]|uniref:toxin regulator n=1 Tax=Cytobacillus kochii TaxID=859143 RepID=UPI0025A094E1|nr:toxin regulator [Cytobacillus kochii]MDM5206315.1 toxin regulator [Cytobacillus kochii]